MRQRNRERAVTPQKNHRRRTHTLTTPNINPTKKQQPGYTQLKPVKGQWTISLAATKTADKTAFEPLAGCNATALSAPCIAPLLSAQNGDKLQANFTLGAPPLKAIDGLNATALVFQACYSKPSTADRPWRKANDVIDKDKACPVVLGTSAPNASSYSFTFAVPKNSTRATWYAQVLAVCANGTTNSYCQYDNTVNATYFGTQIIDSTPPGLIAAAAACSAVGPAFLALFFIRDVLVRKRK
jgi:hypothetical protein